MSRVAPAVLWVAYLFAGVLCFDKTMGLERQDGALAGLLLSTAMFLQPGIWHGQCLRIRFCSDMKVA